MPDVYATITDADPAVVDQLASILAPYMLSLIDRGADLLVANVRIGRQTADTLQTETGRRPEPASCSATLTSVVSSPGKLGSSFRSRPMSATLGGDFSTFVGSSSPSAIADEPIVVADSVSLRHELVLRVFAMKAASRAANRR